MNDKHLFWVLGVLLLIPIGFSMVSHESFRYPCQDPANWDKDICKMPLCDVTRTCPEHIFKGQRDPRLGPPKDGVPPSVAAQTPAPMPTPTGACK
jgi:hypothetical protein